MIELSFPHMPQLSANAPAEEQMTPPAAALRSVFID